MSTALIEPFNFLGRCAWFVARYENTRYNSRRYYNNNISIFQEVRAFETQTSFDREEENYYFPSPTPSNFITFSPSLLLSFSMFTACHPIIVMAAECALYFIIFFTKHFEQGGEKRKAVLLKYLRFSSPRLDRSQSRPNKGSLSLSSSPTYFSYPSNQSVRANRRRSSILPSRFVSVASVEERIFGRAMAMHMSHRRRAEESRGEGPLRDSLAVCPRLLLFIQASGIAIDARFLRDKHTRVARSRPHSAREWKRWKRCCVISGTPLPTTSTKTTIRRGWTMKSSRESAR